MKDEYYLYSQTKLNESLETQTFWLKKYRWRKLKNKLAKLTVSGHQHVVSLAGVLGSSHAPAGAGARSFGLGLGRGRRGRDGQPLHAGRQLLRNWQKREKEVMRTISVK